MSVPRVAILVDLPRDANAGGHVKYWERVAHAAAEQDDLSVDLTLYFSGTGADEILSPYVRYKYLPPVFSTAKLKFLPYVPAHTDLAPFHDRLAQELPNYDVLHTTDGFFAFARTAERIAQWNHIPLVTSFHTDTPAYAELFARQTLQNLLGSFGLWLDRVFEIAARQKKSKEKRLGLHLASCRAILTMRAEDKRLAQQASPGSMIKDFRLGVDKELFKPDTHARASVRRDYNIADDKTLILFVGRVDAGKNVPLLLQACRAAITLGANLHLIVAGLGPLGGEVKHVLGDSATLAGFVSSEQLAQFYAAADCLAIASDIEIGGMIGLEAIACGCPVLVSRVSGVAQICGEPSCMRMVNSSVAAWTQALNDYTQDKEGQKQMRAAALDFRHAKLAGWDQVLNEDFIPVWQDGARKKD